MPSESSRAAEFPLPPSALVMDAIGILLLMAGVLGLVTDWPAHYLPALGDPRNCWVLVGAGVMLMGTAAWQIVAHLQRRKTENASPPGARR